VYYFRNNHCFDGHLDKQSISIISEMQYVLLQYLFIYAASTNIMIKMLWSFNFGNMDGSH